MDIRQRLYRSEQVRALDQAAIAEHGIDGYRLMKRAGAKAFAVARAKWPEAGSMTVCCGAGNNGGDGYVIARLALEAGLAVQLIALKSPDELRDDAKQAAMDWLEAGGAIEYPDTAIRGDLIVDALLGTGLDRPPKGTFAEMIAHVNGSSRPVLAVDVPSGLSADTGMPLEVSVMAEVTVSFIGNKRGLFTGQAARWCGDRLFFDLDTPATIHDVHTPDACLLDKQMLRQRLGTRLPDTHKGDLGHVVVVGGDEGMAGAPILAGQAALRTGSGLVSLATRQPHCAIAIAMQPELMAHATETLDALDDLLARAQVVALGPGLGKSEWSRAVWQRALSKNLPVVVDADALNLLADSDGPSLSDSAILTPHPGEAARLLGCAVSDIQADRFAAARALAKRYRAVTVLKGHGTLIVDPQERTAVCPYGNPGMATAGMGDALTGVIASFLGQGLETFDAACCGVVAHALAGDAAASGRRQILAGDLIDHLIDILPA
ncbi:MAG: NAD(P)H-hydrate dehydratase [Wenzhouxiangella sp.]|jgi:NAD(P)H-hydrate epimerase|nr:NAD(P)H-hydrate dehydratase [Wenzhouxiangella sp.]